MSWRDPQVKKKSPEAPAGDRMSLVYDAAARGDYSAALEIWTPLAHAGVARAQSNIGACFSEGLGVVRDAKLAERWLQLAAEAGDPVGQRNLATLYFRGDGVDQDNARAAALYRAAAEQGDVQVQDMLSWMLLEGDGIAVDRPEARRWAEAAAGQGNAASMTRLGMIFHNALGVDRDPAQAVLWWQRGATRGDADGQAMLGAAYHLGAGVPRDPLIALVWLIRARAGGSPLAAQFFNAVRAALSPEEIDEAERRAALPPESPYMIIGTAGHIDHGKTSLVRALTGVDTDRLKEEKARGISIDLGFAYLPTPDGSVLGFVDVPGHEKFVHNMLAGAAGIDFVLLAIAADDGVMPQTREHLAIVDLLGIDQGLVALTKADLVSPTRLGEVANEIRQALSTTRLAAVDILPVSTVTGEKVDELRRRLFAVSHVVDRRGVRGRFRLAIDRSFTLAGTGTIVTGTVLSGAVSVDDRLVVSPSGLQARVRSIQAQDRKTDRGQAGDRCALNLAGDGIAKDAIARGDMVTEPTLHAPTDRIDATFRLLPSETKSVSQWMPARLHNAAAETGARIVLLGDGPIAPGGEGLIQLVLDRPIAAASGDRFVLRDTTAQRTIGGGKFLDLRAPPRKRRTPERLAQLAAHTLAEPDAALAALLDRPPFFVDLSAFARDRALAAEDATTLLERCNALKLPTAKATLAVSATQWLALKRALLVTLQKFHAEHPDLPGMGLEPLRMQLQPRLPTPGFLSFLEGLTKAGEIALDGAWVRLATHAVRLTDTDEKLWSKIAPLLRGQERFRPPRVRDIAGLLSVREPDVRKLLKLLGRMGKVDEIAHDHFFLRSTVAEMVEIIIDSSTKTQDGQFSAAQFRDRVDNGRKVAIQILEFFDRHGVTLRRGDVRRINKHRLDLFRRVGEPTSAEKSVLGREAFPVERPDFKSGRGRETVLGGFDSLSLPPRPRSAR